MTRSSENRYFRSFQQTRDPRMLGKVFDATAAELLRVAGHLANGDRELTKDALQATFLTAIERADSYDAERDVRPWLLGILANQLRKERRRALRHQSADAMVAELAATGSPVADAQAAEFGALAQAAMNRLSSPFREVMVFHLQHGLTAVEIADALGRPAGTVRTQIVRGMERLRALLPAGFTAAALGMVLTPGPILAAVRQQVLATLPTVATASASSSLVLTGWRLYAMIAASVMVVLSVLYGMTMVGPVVPPDGAAMLATQPVERVTETVAASRDLIAEHAAAPQQAVAKQQAKRDQNLQPVAVEVVYANDQPAANVPVAVRLDGILHRWSTDDRGHVDLQLPWPGSHTLYVLGTYHQSRTLWFEGSRRPKVSQERIVLPLGMQLDVTVVDEHGKPIPGATIDSSNGYAVAGSMLTMLGETDANGRFVREHVYASGKLRVWANGYLPSGLIDSSGEVAGSLVKTVTLLGGAHRAEGVVKDETGKPVAHAQLALVQFSGMPSEPQYFESGEDGSFAIHTLKRGNYVIVGIHKGEVVRRGELRFAHDGAGTTKLELSMTQGARVIGKLVDEQGKLLGGATVYARARPDGIARLPFLEAWTSSGADGAFVIGSLLPGSYELECDHVPSQVVQLADGETFSWQPVRAPLQPITVRLLDALGEPLSGWFVQVVNPGEDWPSSGALTGEDGRFQKFQGQWRYPAGSFCKFTIHKKLGTSDDAWADHVAVPSMITPPLSVGMEHEIRVPVHVTTMHALVGEVVDARQLPLGGAVVTLDKMGLGINGPTNVAMKADATGAFRFDDLPPGYYHAYIQVAGRPLFALPAVEVRGVAEIRLGRLEIPDHGRVAVRLPAGVAGDDLDLILTRSGERASRLRKLQDGMWHSGDVFYGSYELQGWTDTARVVPQRIVVGEPVVAAQLEFVPHQATRIIVDLPHDYARNSSSWRGDLVGTVAGKVVVEHQLRRSFAGTFATHMEFAVSLPAGPLEISVATWDKRKGIATLVVPEGGGGQVSVQIE